MRRPDLSQSEGFARVARPYFIGSSLSLLPAFTTGMIHIGVASSAELKNHIKGSSSEISLLTPRNASLAQFGKHDHDVWADFFDLAGIFWRI